MACGMEEGAPRAPDEVEMKRIYFVRHAHALDRELWRHDDEHRPLTERGYRQADGIRRALGRARIQRVVSSRAYRCTDTLWPLADALGLRVDRSDALFEGGSARGVLDLMRRTRDARVALCTHGDVMQNVLEHLERDGVRLEGGMRFAKGAWWVFDLEGPAGVVAASYHPATTE